MVNALMKKYNTYDPFELASKMGIIVIREELGTINGYYNKCYRQRFIHINHSLSDIEQYYICSHELAHAVLHKDINISFYKAFTHLNTDKIEKEADEFALELMSHNKELIVTESELIRQALKRSRCSR